MRPYWAIITDSFRAAMASRVLYVMLALITLLLIGLAPFHLREQIDWKLSFGDHIRNPESLARRLVASADDEPDRPRRRVWDQLTPQVQADLRKFDEHDRQREQQDDAPEEAFGEFGGRERMRVYGAMVDDLNRVIAGPLLFDPAVWEPESLPAEARQWIEGGVSQLNEAQQHRLNRILIEEAFGYDIRPSPPTSVTLRYAIWTVFTASQTRGQLASQLTTWLPFFFDKFVMSFGLFVAILLTASLIPEMLEPGSLNLLLSKPMFRWGLLLAKFIGGCAFVTLCAVYLFVGVWLVLGIRLGIWERSLLLSIPLYVIVFAIYFSLALLVGLLYRSTILTVIVTIVFWGVCFVVGVVYQRFESRLNQSEILRAVPAGNEVLQIDRLGNPYVWDDDESRWKLAFITSGNRELAEIFYITSFFVDDFGEEFPMMIGPVYDPNRDVMVAGQIDLQRVQSSQRTLAMSRAEIDWQVKSAGNLPSGTMALLHAEPAGVIAATGTGELFRLSGDVEAALTEPQDARAENDADKAEGSDKKGLIANLLSPKADLFTPAGPDERLEINDGWHVAMNAAGQIAAYHRGILAVFNLDNQSSYRRQAEMTVDTGTDPSITTWLGFGGQSIVVALGNGTLITIDAERFEQRAQLAPETRSAIVKLSVSPQGHWGAVTYANGHVWLLNLDEDTASRAPVSGQGSISMAMFDEAGRLWVADRTDRLTAYEPDSWNEARRLSPTGSIISRLHRYAVRPLYRVCPKPGEFHKLVTHLSASANVKKDPTIDLTQRPEPENPWAPLTSGLAFMAAMLVIACVVFQRQDF